MILLAALPASIFSFLDAVLSGSGVGSSVFPDLALPESSFLSSLLMIASYEVRAAKSSIIVEPLAALTSSGFGFPEAGSIISSVNPKSAMDLGTLGPDSVNLGGLSPVGTPSLNWPL